MAAYPSGTVALLAYADDHPLDVARLISDFHAILAPLQSKPVVLAWDCDGLAIFDLPATRIALGWDDGPGKGYSACLLVSVSPRPNIQPRASCDQHEDMCSRLVEQLHERYPALAMHWYQTAEELTGDLLDHLVDGLPPLTRAVTRALPIQEPDRTVVDPVSSRSSGPAPAPGRSEAVKDYPSLPAIWSRELAWLREALYPAEQPDEVPEQRDEAPERLNAKLRLAVHVMNAALILVWAPLGAAAMTYSLLRGEDMTFSARLVALTGLFACAINTPIGQQMVAIAGV